MLTTPNMSLVELTIGVDSGLLWEQGFNANAAIIDNHNHTPGYGALIPPSGLNINSDLTFSGNSPTNLKSVVFLPQTSLSTLNALFVKGVDLYYNDGSGDPSIQITSGGGVNATSSGISSGTATAAFSSSVLVVNAAANTPANTQVASILLGNNVANSKFLTLSPPAAMAANISQTLPVIPGVTSIMVMDTSGNMAAQYTVDNSTVVIASNVIKVPTGGITATQLASDSVTTVKILDQNVTTAKIADANVTTGKIANLAVTTGKIDNTAVTSDKLSNFNHAQSTSSGTYTAPASGTWNDVTGLSVSFTAQSNNRGIMLMLVPDGTSGHAVVTLTGGDTMQFLRDSTAVGLTDSQQLSTMMDYPAAGTYTYKVQTYNATGGSVFNNVRLQVMQL